jgi:hypothetical protein
MVNYDPDCTASIPENSNVTMHHCDSLKSCSDFLFGVGEGKGHSATYNTGDTERWRYSFFNLGARWGWVVSATSPSFYPRETFPVQEAGWAPKPIWMDVENLTVTGVRTPNRLSYPCPVISS